MKKLPESKADLSHPFVKKIAYPILLEKVNHLMLDHSNLS
jgi:hypothetical protein